MRKPFNGDSMQERQSRQGRCAAPPGEGRFLLQLVEQQRARQMAEVEAVLAELAATGMVLAEKGKDGRTRYGVDPQKLSEIGAHLPESLGPGRAHPRLARRRHRRHNGGL